ncbi:MAG TPA: ATP-dependent helicase HrpB [Planctomycetaceae bacterium]|nr:ATP-dependent helicase HrpB [Planctomycetaceae bacterium]
MPLPLPIDKCLPEVSAALARHACLTIAAAPGSGKTTRVAPALLGTPVVRPSRLTDTASSEHWTAGNRVLLIQPRRVAARTAAERIAAEHRTSVGAWAGYHVRFEKRVGADCRCITMTPGVLLRRLQSDPILDDISAVILDEFHERSLEYDLLLGMLQIVQSQMRPDLKLVIMSATLDGSSLTEHLPDCGSVNVEGTMHPVKMMHQKHSARVSSRGRHGGPASRTVGFRATVDEMTQAVHQMANKYDGDILAFLPGVGEIRAVEQNLLVSQESWDVLPLYGSQRPEEQNLALAPSSKRKVILATNIAETSLTIDGVRIVIDSGQARVQRFCPKSGLDRLVLEPISKASATQRAGRAGRTQSGVCYRLWDEVVGRSRPEHLAPEVQRVDLAPAVLRLICWGESDLSAFPWLTPPSDAAIESAVANLQLLGAVVDDKPTRVGKLLSTLPVHPRLGLLLLVGHAIGEGERAALAAALLSERDIVDRQWVSRSECDIVGRLEILERGDATVNRNAARQVARAAEQLKRETEHVDFTPPRWIQNIAEKTDSDGKLKLALLAGFPDRVAKRRGAGSPRGAMVGGRGVQLGRQSGVKTSECFLCLEVDGKGANAQVGIASGISPEWLRGPLRREEEESFYNPTLESVVTRLRDYWCDLMLGEQPIQTEDQQLAGEVLAKEAAKRFRSLLPSKDKAIVQWVARVDWLRHVAPELAEGLPFFEGPNCEQMLRSLCYGMRSMDELAKLPWSQILPAQASPSALATLDREAPAGIRLPPNQRHPQGREVRLTYEPGKEPVLAAKIQELFGWKATPAIAGGRRQLLLHLLAPNGRVQQITDDLASFWSNTYPQVRKDLRGRYPKHDWPENPLG